MDDQILQADEEPRAETASDPTGKLRKREQRLLERLQEAQQKEARALERLRRAGARLQRRRTRLERINNHLTLIRQQIADLQVTDRQPEQVDSMVPVTSEPASMNGSEVNAASVQAAPELVPGSDAGASTASEVETEATSDSTSTTSTTTELEAVSTSGSTSTATEPASTPVSNISTTTGAESTSPADSEQEAPREVEPEGDLTPEVASSPEQEDALPASHEQAPASTPEPEIAAPPVTEPASHEQAPTSTPEPEVTTRLVVEQENQVTSEVPAQAVLLAREAWDAAEAEVLSARNTAHGIASSISFLSQSGGLSSESMSELLRKQSEANKAVVRAQNAARLAYERFIQAQAEAERAAGQQPGAVEGHTQQNQENGALPAQDNAADATVHIQTIRPY